MDAKWRSLCYAAVEDYIYELSTSLTQKTDPAHRKAVVATRC